MKRNDYQKPQINIVEIPLKACLLVGSDGQTTTGDAGTEDYNCRDKQDW